MEAVSWIIPVIFFCDLSLPILYIKNLSSGGAPTPATSQTAKTPCGCQPGELLGSSQEELLLLTPSADWAVGR